MIRLTHLTSLIRLHRPSTPLTLLILATAVLVFSSASPASAQSVPTGDTRWFELPNHDQVRVYTDSSGASGVEKLYEYAASGVASPRTGLAGDCRSVSLTKPQLVNAPAGKLSTAAPEFRWVLGANKVDGMQFHLIVENQVGVAFSLFSNASAPELWIFPDNFAANRTYTWRSYYSCTLNGRSGPVASGSFVAGSGEGRPSIAGLLTPEDKGFILNTDNSGQIDFTWNGNAPLFILEFQPRNDPDWPDPSLWAAYGVWQAGSSKRVPVFSTGREMAWRVRSHNGAGNSDPWQGYTFKVVSQLPAYRVTGRVVDVTGQGVPDVLISDDKGAKAYTAQDGRYTLANVLYGKRTITAERYLLMFAPRSQQIDVRTDTTAPDFRMTAPPIVIVHGIQTFASKDTKCSEGIVRYKTPDDSMLGDMPAMLSILGNVVFIAHLDSGRSNTNYIEVNALCLEEQIKQVYAKSGNTKVIIVAHSMGGLVARACLASEACRSKVSALYTLGTPHNGTMVMSFPQFGADLLGTDFCERQAAICQLDKIYVSLYFNPYYPNQRGIQYYFIGGDHSPWYGVDQITAPWEPHDGLVSSYSAVGWLAELNAILEPDWSKPSKPTRYWTDEVHTDFFGDKAYDRLRNGQPSQSANCIISGILALPVPADCHKASFTLPKASANALPLQVTRWISGSVDAGHPATHTVQIDARGEARFTVLWPGSPLQVTLRTPDGLEISPTSAAAAPDQFSYKLVEQSPELPGMASYLVADAQPGAWSIVVGTSDASARTYGGYAATSSPLALTVSYSPSMVLNGAAGVITASLAAGVGLLVEGAVVTATLLAPDGTSTSVELSDQGNGHYAGSFTAPASAGLVPVLVQAAGELSGQTFERAQFFVLPVGSADIRLAGNISEQAVDANGDGRYSRLDIGLDIEVGSPGHYVVSAQLRRDGQLLSVATTATDLLQPGRHRVVLGFRGADILANGVDGPYTAADAVVIGVEHGGVPSAHAEELYITAPYRSRDFTDRDASDVYMPQVLR